MNKSNFHLLPAKRRGVARWKEGSDNFAQYRSVSIIMMDQSGRTIARWNVHWAWPVKWEGPTLKASGNEVAIESIELAHEGLTLSEDDR